MEFIEDERPPVEHIFFDDNNVSIDTVEDEVRLGTKRDMQPGRCIYLDSTNKITGTLPLFEDRKVTFTTWIKFLGGTSQVLFHIGEMRLIMLSSGQFRTYWSAGSNYEVAAGVIPFNTWGHLGVVLSPSICLVFWNGVEVLRREGASHAGIVSSIADNNFAIGYRHDTVTEVSYFKGYLFDTRIHQGDTPTVIIDAFNNKFTTARGWYKFDEGAGSIAYDSSGNGRHGTWTGLVTSSHYVGADVPFSYQNTVGFNKIDSVFDSLDDASKWTKQTENTVFEVAAGKLRTTQPTTDFQYIGDNYLNNMIRGAVGTVSRVRVTFTITKRVGQLELWIGSVWLGSSTRELPIGKHTYEGNVQKLAPTETHTRGRAVFAVNGNNLGTSEIEIEDITVEFLTIYPRNEANPRFDVLGNKLIYEGLAPLKPTFKQSHCGYFNGTHVVNFGTQFTQDLHRFDVEFWLNSAGTTGAGYIGYRCDQTSTIAGWCIKRINSSQAQFWYRVAGNTGNTSLTFNLSTGLNHIKIEKRTAATVTSKVYVNGVLAAELNMNTGIHYDVTRSTYLGAIQGGSAFSQYLTGEIWGVKITDYDTGLIVLESPLSEGGGGVIHNVAGTQHGTLTGDVAVFWSKRQNLFHENITRGFSTMPLQTVPIKDVSNTYWKMYSSGNIIEGMGSFTTSLVAFTNTSNYLLSPFTKYRLTFEVFESVKGGFQIWGGQSSTLNTASLSNAVDGFYELFVTTGDLQNAQQLYNQLTIRHIGSSDATAFQGKIRDMKIENLTKYPSKNATQDVLNSTLTNPAGKWYNMAETQIDFTGGVAVPNLPTAWKGEADTSFMNSRRRGNKIDRICIDSVAPTGNRLLIQKQYTEKP